MIWPPDNPAPPHDVQASPQSWQQHLTTQGLLGAGFPGERMLVLPRPLVRAALQHPVTGQLLVTDSGFFPHAARHGRARAEPIEQAVLLLCLRGRGWCETQEGVFAVAPGQIVLLPPHRAHAYWADEEDPWTLWWLHAAGESIPGLIDIIGTSGAAPVRVPADPTGAALLAAEVVAAMEQDTTQTSLVAASGTAWHLFTALATSRAPVAGTDELVERAAAHLRQHVGRRTSVAELAASVGLSTSHFAAVFRRRLGVPVTQYQTQLRMARARELLDTTDLPIAQIAERCGYDDPLYFARQFRAVHGTSPTGHRQRNED